MTSSFKKDKSKIRSDIDMLLLVEKDIRGGICHSIYWYAKANNQCIKDYDKNKEPSYLQYRNVNSLYGWAMCQSFQKVIFSESNMMMTINDD